MTKLHELIDVLETIAPLHLQESYDNAGLIVGNPMMEVKGVTVCLDSTEAVVDEAIASGHNVIVAHHPIIFAGLRKLTGKTYIERCIIKAIKNDIAIYAIHTNLDNVLENGVNEKIAQRLGLEDYSILMPKNPSNTEIGSGIIGHLKNPTSTDLFLESVKEKMKADCLKHTEVLTESVQKIAVCGGSGSFLLEQAIAENCDVFISADFKYHQFFDANNQIVIIDIGHFETEQFTIDLLVEIISNNFSNFAAQFTKVNTNPVKYI